MRLIQTITDNQFNDVGWGTLLNPYGQAVFWYDVARPGAKEACEAEMRRYGMRDPILTEHGKAEFQKAIQTAQDAATPIPMKTFTSGAKSTIQKPMYHLIPLTALELLAERFGYGAARHGERNYRKGGNDPEFINDRVNHLFEHVVNFAEHRRQEDLAAILCNAAILADIKAFINPDITKENS